MHVLVNLERSLRQCIRENSRQSTASRPENLASSSRQPASPIVHWSKMRQRNSPSLITTSQKFRLRASTGGLGATWRQADCSTESSKTSVIQRIPFHQVLPDPRWTRESNLQGSSRALKNFQRIPFQTTTNGTTKVATDCSRWRADTDISVFTVPLRFKEWSSFVALTNHKAKGPPNLSHTRGFQFSRHCCSLSLNCTIRWCKNYFGGIVIAYARLCPFVTTISQSETRSCVYLFFSRNLRHSQTRSQYTVVTFLSHHIAHVYGARVWANNLKGVICSRVWQSNGVHKLIMANPRSTMWTLLQIYKKKYISICLVSNYSMALLRIKEKTPFVFVR